MAKLLTSLPMTALQEVPGYNTTQHTKALAAYEKIMKCLKNYEQFQTKKELENDRLKSSSDINPLCLSPNDQHYRLNHRTQNSLISENSNAGVGPSERVEANIKTIPKVNTSTINESLRTSQCKKLLDFSSRATVTGERKVNTPMHQIISKNTPRTVSKADSSLGVATVTSEGKVNTQVHQITPKNTPKVIPQGNSRTLRTVPKADSNVLVASPAQCSSIQSNQTTSSNLINAQKGTGLRKFTFGSHLKLPTENSTPTNSDKNGMSTTNNARPLLSAANTFGTLNISANTSTFGKHISSAVNTTETPSNSALVSANTSTFEKPNVQSLWQKNRGLGSSSGVKTSTAKCENLSK